MAEEDTGPEEGKVRLKYVGSSHYREISAADFRSVGVEDQGAIRVASESALVRAHDYKTPQVAEITQDAADFLLETEPDDWEETDEPPTAPFKAKATVRRLQRAQAKEEAALKASESGEGEGGLSGTPGDTNAVGGSSTAGDTSTSTSSRASGRGSTRSR